MQISNNSANVRDTSFEAHINNQISGRSAKLTAAIEIILDENPQGLHRGEIAKKLILLNLISKDSSMSHPVSNLQEKGVAKELKAEKRPTSIRRRYVIKLNKHVLETDVYSKKQIEKYEQ